MNEEKEMNGVKGILYTKTTDWSGYSIKGAYTSDCVGGNVGIGRKLHT